MHKYLYFLLFSYCCWLVLFYVSLSLSFFRIVYAWHPSVKLLCPRTLFILGHHLLLILPLFMLGSVMIKLVKTFRRTFLGMAFIQNARSSFWIFLIMTYPLSFTVGVRSPFVIIHEFYSNMHGFDYSIPRLFTSVQGIRIVVTLELISNVLHVPRVSHLDYPGCPHLKTVSKDELMSLFCETPSFWGER